jgi:hypothetical protein
MCELTREEINEIKQCVAHNKNIQNTVESSNKRLIGFIEQYELDMRGDKDLGNGNRGVIGEIRYIKHYQKEYPSLTWLLKHHPIKTGGAILFVFMLIMTLYNLGLMQFLLAYFGVSTP